jgi:hypothetical protein
VVCGFPVALVVTTQVFYHTKIMTQQIIVIVTTPNEFSATTTISLLQLYNIQWATNSCVEKSRMTVGLVLEVFLLIYKNNVGRILNNITSHSLI